MNHTNRLHWIAAAAAALALSGAAWGQATAPGTTRAASAAKGDSVARADAAFLKQAAENGHTEVEGSKLAQSKATNPKVKAFAEKMMEDHTKAGAELSTLAASKGVEVPTEPSLMQKGKLKLLSTADGANFDKKYADEVGVKAHEDTVKLFEKGAAEAKDPDVKAWATKTLPTLKMHLQHAKEMQAAVK